MNGIQKYAGLAGLLWVLGSGAVCAQGPLAPPGAPAPTMKTLGELEAEMVEASNVVGRAEARIDLAEVAGDASYCHVISESGSYYLSRNLEVAQGGGVHVNATGVTLDLNGFAIVQKGEGTSGVHISLQGALCTLINGTIRNFESGVLSYGINARFEDLVLTECSTEGMYVTGASKIINCRAFKNTGKGFNAAEASVLTGCIADGNQGDYGIYAGAGSVLSDCLARSNSQHGIHTEPGCVLIRCVAKKNAGMGIYGATGSSLRGCVARDNSYGFYLENACVLSDCTAEGSQNSGFHAVGRGTQFTGCLARNNALNGFSAGKDSSLEECLATGNSGQYGIFAGLRSIIQGCTSAYNEFTTYSSAGIHAEGHSTVQECVVMGNSSTYASSGPVDGKGIYVGEGSLVKNCSVCQNQGDGIRALGASQLIGNQCDGNGPYLANTGAGIYVVNGACRIEGNQLTDNDYGLQGSGSTNLVVGNSAAGNADDYDVTGTQLKGTVITAPGTVSTKDSWANFEF
ncbi:MAG: right-handed parallel beta-helix repeat-containing protein [Kiritimatiellales bacterium]|nr:right-handed parallel beta-helix repeat-containing protein [Kiritimatiellales bacterium]